ncbi:MAG: recombination protein O N-terminal domain-containing protein, partial [Parcubacteria group bacterium]|nr:recombination protein O N-terminal domain-containing protein [Parcubacteria group bacterium]
MPTFKTKGIIIKKNNAREADKIFTIVTDNLGKIQAYGRSTGKITSKLGGHLDLFTNSNLVLARGRSMPT